MTGLASRARLFAIVVSLAMGPGCASDGPKPTEPTEPARGPTPDATIRISAKSLSAGIGYSWGEGTLEYQGATHTVSMSGVLVLALGFTSVDAKGAVYNLKSLDDFGGRYEAPRGGAALGTGAAGVVMRNAKGVEVRMVAENTGVTLTIGDSPVKLEVEE